MLDNSWFKKERPLLGLLGSGGGVAGGAAGGPKISMRVMIIGSGGGGGEGQGGGGGGAGGVRTSTIEIETGVEHSFYVGKAGSIMPGNPPTEPTINNRGMPGENSWFSDPTIGAGYGGGGGGQSPDGPTGGFGGDGGGIGGNAGGGGNFSYTTAGTPGGASPTSHPEVQGNRTGGYGYAGPGGGSGNRGGGGGGAGDAGNPAQRNPTEPVGNAPQNPGSPMTGGNGGSGYQVPTDYFPEPNMPNFLGLAQDAFPTNAYGVPSDSQQMLGMKSPSTPQGYMRMFAGGGGGGCERSTGGTGGGAPSFPTHGNYGGGGNGGPSGPPVPGSDQYGGAGLNGRGAGGGGGGPGNGGGGHPGGSGLLLIQYPTTDIASISTGGPITPGYVVNMAGPGPEGYGYYMVIGQNNLGASPPSPASYTWNSPSEGTVTFNI